MGLTANLHWLSLLYLTNNLNAYIERYKEIKDDFCKSTQLKISPALNDTLLTFTLI